MNPKAILTWCVALTTFSLQSQVLWHIRKDTVITYYHQDGDEFDGSQVNREKWSSWFGWARSIASNKEQQYYSEYENHDIADGALNLTVRKKQINARLIDWKGDNDSIKDGKRFLSLNKRDFNYSAGLIQSKKEFLYGYFEIKFRAPAESGLWPAFWLYGGTPNEEIDFMELNGVHQDQIHVDTHCADRCDYKKFRGQNRSFGGWIKLKGKLDEGYNIVSGTWDENEVRFYLNGEFLAVSKVKFNVPKVLVANVAVPSNDGPFHPGPDPSVEQFSPLSIDYIRVWSKDKTKADANVQDVSENKYALNCASMKRPVKRMYGDKKERENEDAFVSVLRNKNGDAVIYYNCAAKKNVQVKLMDASGKTVFEGEAGDREFKLPVKPATNYVLELKYGDRLLRHVF